MGAVVDLADRLWRGEESVHDRHPVSGRNIGDIEEITDGVAFLPSFANVTAIATDDGLVLVDTGSAPLAGFVHEQVRRWNADPLNVAVYSHGHIDHVFGVPVFEDEARTNGWRSPRVIAHEALPARFDRYLLTLGYNTVINQRQFGFRSGFTWPSQYRYPDETYRDTLDVEIGGTLLQLHHTRGETDDHTWTWIPERRVLCSGDLFIWATPNAGNPQKVQRYPKEWADGLRMMVSLGPEFLLPGHGYPVIGSARVSQALTDTADLLESLHDQTIALMNEGASLNEVIHTVALPAHLLDRPYLQPVYDEPEFIVRNIWRLYGGWYDGDPSHLKPASDASLATALVELCGGAATVVERAIELSDAGDHRLACHLVEFAWQAASDDETVRETRSEIYRRRVATETSTMAKGVFGWASEESRNAEQRSG